MGKLYGISAGPGDPELLTLKAVRILREADVIFCPVKEEGAESTAFEIIKGVLRDVKAETVFLVYPMLHRSAELEKKWEENGALIAEKLAGDRVGAFITLGEVSVYSTFHYTLPYMEKAGIPVEIIPGVTSFCAVADAAQLPLMTGHESLFVTSVRKHDGGYLEEVLRTHENVVLMKPSSNKEALIRALQAHRTDRRFVLISEAGTEHEVRMDKPEQLEDYEIPYFSTVVVKKKQ